MERRVGDEVEIITRRMSVLARCIVLGAAALVRLLLVVYFRRIEIFHAERVPAGPVLFVANHPGSVTDAFVVSTSLPRRAHFLATAQMFRFRPLAWLLHHCGIIPLNRREDDPAAMRSVTDSFGAAYRVLDGGGGVVIFPEGVTYDDARLKALRMGARDYIMKPFEVPVDAPAVPGATDANMSACLQSRRHATNPPREKPVTWFFFGSVRKTSATFWMIFTTVSSSDGCHVLPGPPGQGGPVGATTTKPRCLPSAFRFVFASMSAPVPVSPWISVMRPQPGFTQAVGIETSTESPSHVKV